MPWPFRRKRQDDEPRSAYFKSKQPLLSYWLYFDVRAQAEAALERLRAMELAADLQRSAGRGRQWLVLAYRELPESPMDIDREASAVSALAVSLGGEYDGWEAGPLEDASMAEEVRSWPTRDRGRR